MNDKKFLIRPQDLEAVIDDRALRIVDCRFSLMDPDAGRREYEQAHIPGAVYADLDKDLAGPAGPETGRHPLPDTMALCETFGRLGIDAETLVVAYDDSAGAVAARAWWLLRWMGHDNAVLLDGGFNAWMALGLPVEAGAVVAAQARFEGSAKPELVLQTSDIGKEGVDGDDYLLVDARSAVRFRGDEEPIDPVAGHVPGAVNLPFEVNVDDNGCWNGADAVRAQLQTVLGSDRKRPWAAMCGSGVTACHLVVAALMSGYREPRVYVGSWSEWIRDEERKVATGAAELA